jgi:hypothetical protein
MGLESWKLRFGWLDGGVDGDQTREGVSGGASEPNQRADEKDLTGWCRQPAKSQFPSTSRSRTRAQSSRFSRRLDARGKPGARLDSSVPVVERGRVGRDLAARSVRSELGDVGSAGPNTDTAPQRLAVIADAECAKDAPSWPALAYLPSDPEEHQGDRSPCRCRPRRDRRSESG